MAATRKPNHMFDQCDAGPLSSVAACRSDHSLSGNEMVWWYSAALGSLDNMYCDKMSLNTDELTIPIKNQPDPEHLFKTECSVLQASDEHICYASQRIINQGNARLLNILITDERCGDAHFLRAANMRLTGKGFEPNTQWQKPYDVIREVKE